MSTNRTSGSARSTGRSGSARSGIRYNPEQSKNKKLELKFHTSTSGGNKSKYANYTAVKDSIVIKMQKTLHSEVIKSIRDEVLFDMNIEKPKRQWSKSIVYRSYEKKDKRTYEFDTKIIDDPIVLLKEIAKVIHQPQRSSYPYEVVAEGLQRIINMKQMNEESLAQYTERFKHERSVIKGSLGINFLDTFVESTKEYQDVIDSKE